MKHSLVIKDYNGEVINIKSNEVFKKEFIIVCDGVEDTKSFTFEDLSLYKSVVELNRCYITITIPNNKTAYEREFLYRFSHNEDSDIYLDLKITQEADEYDLIIQDDITLKSIIEGEYEKKIVPISVKGGSRNYNIKGIKTHFSEGLNKKFNNEISYIKQENSIVIINNGRPFLENDRYFVITLCHKDKPDLEKKLIVKYDDIQVKEKEKKVDKPIKNIEQNTDMYFVKKNDLSSKPKDKGSNEKLVIEPINDLILIGKSSDTIDFKVKKGNNVSNLMVSALVHANWCKVDLKQHYDDKNNIVRNIKLEIKDIPLNERKCIVELYVIDDRKVNTNFMLTNKKE